MPVIAWGSVLLLGGLAFLVVSLIFVLIRALVGGGRKRSLNDDEKQMLRQIWEAQDRMEERITHLETILLERK